MLLFAKLLHEKPGTRAAKPRAAINEGVSPRRKIDETTDSFVLSGDNEVVKVTYNYPIKPDYLETNYK